MNVRNLGRFAISLATLLVVIIGLPIALMAASAARFGSANPLTGLRPPWMWEWAGAGETLSAPLADAEVIDAIVRVSLCVVWAAVAITILTTIGELVHTIRHRGLPLPQIRGLHWSQPIARFIAVGLVTVLPAAAPATSLASTVEARMSATASTAAPNESTTPEPGTSPTWVGQLVDGDGSQTTHRSTPTGRATDTAALAGMSRGAPPTTRMVGPGESIYSIAVDLGGADTARITEIADAIIDANLGVEMPSGQRFTNPAYIETGWSLIVPAGLSAANATNAAVAAPQTGHPTQAAVDVHVVEPGDTLWTIASQHLGDPMAWSQIWDDNAGNDMGDGRTFDDPDLILPGWQLEVSGSEPAPAPETAPTGLLPAEPASDTDVPGVDGSVTDIADVHPSTTAAVGDDRDVAEGAEAGAAETPPATTVVAPSSTTALPTDGRDAGAAEPAGAAAAPQAPSPIRLEHAALLAAGILALVGVRRRQRLRTAQPRHRVPEPHPDVSDTERRLRRVGTGERELRVDVACRAAAWSLIGTGHQIGWVLASPDGAIELRLTGPSALPAPWVGAGQAWRLGAEAPVELLGEDARRVGQPCVALIQLGVTPDGDEVIVDLEAAGRLVVDAPGDLADEVVTAVAASLASSVFAEVAHLIGVSLPSTALLDHRNAHVTESSDAALDLATALTGTTSANERTTFELRSLRTGGEMWEPAVVLLRADDDSGHEIGAVEPGHGVAVVIADDRERFEEADARLLARADGWRLDAFGTTVALTPIGINGHDLACLADLLADASRELEPIEPVEPVELRFGHGRTDPVDFAAQGAVEDGDADDPTAAPSPLAPTSPTGEVEPITPFEPGPFEIVVGLLGAVDVRTRDGEVGSFERSKTVELIAWLATHRDRATRSNARTALWEMDVRDATFANVVSEARRGLARLVAPPDDEEWVGRTLTEQLPLHHLVVTDADLVQERLTHARLQPPSQAIETLRPAVELVREMPFAGTGYLWPDAEGLTSNLVMMAITATAEFAAHALSLGDTEDVFWATTRGLRVLSGHEELIALRMRAHARSGDLAGVRQEWESYERVLIGDAWSDGEPAPHLLALRRQLLDQ